MPSAFEKTLVDPNTPHYPEILEEASYVLPNQTAIVHSICSVLFRRETTVVEGYALSVYPPGAQHINDGKWDYSQPSFTVCVYSPDGASLLGWPINTDFETVLPNAVQPRNDNPSKRMLTPSGRDRILNALRYGTYHHDFGSQQYGGRLGIDTIHNLRRKIQQ